MSAYRNLAIRGLMIALFLGSLGCPAKETRPTPPPPPVEEPEDDAPSDVKLRAACFDGDQSACDKLGH